MPELTTTEFFDQAGDSARYSTCCLFCVGLFPTVGIWEHSETTQRCAWERQFTAAGSFSRFVQQ